MEGERGREREIEQTFRRGGWKGRAIGGDGIQRKNGKTQSRHKSCDIDFAANFPRCRPRHIRDSSCDAAITSLTGIKIQLYIKLSYIAPYLYLSRWYFLRSTLYHSLSLSFSFSFLVAPLASASPPFSDILSFALERSCTLSFPWNGARCIYVSYLYMWKIDLDASFDRSASFDHRDFWWFCSVILHKNREHLMRYVWGGN